MCGIIYIFLCVLICYSPLILYSLSIVNLTLIATTVMYQTSGDFIKTIDAANLIGSLYCFIFMFLMFIRNFIFTTIQLDTNSSYFKKDFLNKNINKKKYDDYNEDNNYYDNNNNNINEIEKKDYINENENNFKNNKNDNDVIIPLNINEKKFLKKKRINSKNLNSSLQKNDNENNFNEEVLTNREEYDEEQYNEEEEEDEEKANNFINNNKNEKFKENNLNNNLNGNNNEDDDDDDDDENDEEIVMKKGNHENSFTYVFPTGTNKKEVALLNITPPIVTFKRFFDFISSFLLFFTFLFVYLSLKKNCEDATQKDICYQVVNFTKSFFHDDEKKP